MTDADKLKSFERVRAIVEDQTRLERHYEAQGKNADAINFICASAYARIAEALADQRRPDVSSP